jgi:uncharacterized protein (TIGR03435 family)
MHTLLMTAYGLRMPDQLLGPNWLDKERYEIVAKVPRGATKEQLNLMLRSLLEERFQIKVHHETKQLPIYELTVVKKGVIEKATLETDSPIPRDAQLPPGPRWGLIGRACGKSTEPVYCGHARILGRQQSTADIADMVREMLGRLTLDKSGLTGKYDFVLDFAPESVNIPSVEPAGAAPALNAESYPAFSVALERQLGLQIESKKGPVEMLVIDRIEKVPTGN